MNQNIDVPLSAHILKTRIGEEIGVSQWRKVDQKTINRFADATADYQFIHVDAKRAATETPFGGTIAHGLLTLAFLPVMAEEALPVIEGQKIIINYGYDRIRFLTPVPVDAQVRGRFTLTDLIVRSDTESLLHYQVTVEIEGATKPALVADWLVLSVQG